ncbi:MAG: GntR family transcriptional regulator [Propionibacteriaceae bacterium]
MEPESVRRAAAKQVDVALDRSSPVPLYHQLAQAIESAIHEGRLMPGDRLENELSLTARLGVARPTARQAIQELTKKGLVVRKRGVGTQVLNLQISRDTRLSSLFDDLDQAGRHPSTLVLDVGTGASDPETAELLVQATADPDITRVRRLRRADGVPLAILTNHIPTRYGVTPDDLVERGLYACLRLRGVNLRVAHQRIGARLMSAEEAKLLGEARPAACLTAVRTVYDDAGRFVELGQHVYRASHYTLDGSLVP